MKLLRKSIWILIVLPGCLYSAVRSPSLCHAQRSKIPPDLVQKLFDDIQTDKFRLSEEDKKIIKENLHWRLQDINRDTIPEIFLFVNHMDWCGAGSNCNVWVYQKTKSGYKLLLEDNSLIATNVFTKGFRDIQSRVPIGFCSKEEYRFGVVTYKYDGKEYQSHSGETHCMNRKTQRSRILQDQ
jgi:hypothetical protein